jgi:hypothetical protein
MQFAGKLDRVSIAVAITRLKKPAALAGSIMIMFDSRDLTLHALL